MNNLTSLKGKTAIVTGGASGIGRGIVHALAEAGANVTIADLNAEGGAAVVKEIEALGSQGLVVKTDVSRWDDVRRMVDQTLARFGRVDVLVNDAGTTAPQRSILDMTEEAWDLVMAVNLKGPMFCCKAVLPHMQKQKSGAIVNISSSAGFRAMPANSVPYNCSKAAVAHMGRTLAVQFAPDNIRVNSIAPGLVDTPLTRRRRPNREDMLEDARTGSSQNPLGVVLEPRDIGQAVLYLVSDAGRYVTGQTLQVNGGMVMP